MIKTMTHSIPWHQATNIPYYRPATTHPDWAFADITTDSDVYWFHLKPMEAWTAFAFDYMGERFTLRYRKKERFIQLMLYLPGVDAPDEAQELAEMGLDWGDYRCSVWLCDQVEREEEGRGPDMVVRYHLSKPFEVFLQMPFREKMQVGVYTAHWET